MVELDDMGTHLHKETVLSDCAYFGMWFYSDVDTVGTIDSGQGLCDCMDNGSIGGIGWEEHI